MTTNGSRVRASEPIRSARQPSRSAPAHARKPFCCLPAQPTTASQKKGSNGPKKVRRTSKKRTGKKEHSGRVSLDALASALVSCTTTKTVCLASHTQQTNRHGGASDAKKKSYPPPSVPSTPFHNIAPCFNPPRPPNCRRVIQDSRDLQRGGWPFLVADSNWSGLIA